MKKLLCVLMALLLLSIPSSLAQEAAQKPVAILYTNDVHCAIDAYAQIAARKSALEKAGYQVILVDAGDAIQGDAVGTLTTGESIVQLMNAAGYDLAVPGNHEFDYGMDRFLQLKDLAEYTYISANFVRQETGECVLPAYQIIDCGGFQIGFVGVCTPKTITSSTPAYFQDENGEFIYGFCQDADGAALYAQVQSAVDAAAAEGADVIVAIAHLGIVADCTPWMSNDLIANTRGIDAVIDGHSHSTIQGENVDNLDGEDVLLTSTGTKLVAYGEMTITQKGDQVDLTSALIPTVAVDEKVTALTTQIKGEFDALLSKVVAKSEVDLTVVDPVTGVRIVRSAESNLGDLCADACRFITKADIAFVNGGGVRDNIAAGEVTYGQIIKVHPYGNELCMIEATGQEILDALEIGARAIPGETGSFLQVSGMTYEIHTGVPSSVQLDDDGMFIGVAGEYRVKNVMVGDAPLELDKSYTVASYNYLLKNNGGGFTMFNDNTLLLDSIMLDNQVLINYITQGLSGVVGSEYADPYGQGRIVAVAETK